MKNRISLLGIIAIIAIIGLGFTACDGDDGSGSTTVAVTGVTVVPTTLALTVGGSTGTLSPTIAPGNATNKAVTWSTSNVAIATISNSIVTAVSAGIATIKVTTTDGSKTATCSVTVTAGDSFVPEYAIGDVGPGGGKIIYISASGFNVTGLGICHYLEATPTNQAISVTWSSTSVDVTGATGTAIGTGKVNTAEIIAAHQDDTASNNAAKAAVAYTDGGKNDWFLPSKDELNEMYKAKTHLGISSGHFWSSSQDDNGFVWDQNITNGVQDYYLKNNGFNVRAIRAF